MSISQLQARRFLLSHQKLLPPFQLEAPQGVLDFIQHVGSIQFDPVNVVARNPDLVLQARVRDYRPSVLHDLLYRQYLLYDAWDKQSSICLTSDWAYFSRHRLRMEKLYWNTDKPESRLAVELLEKIRLHGHEKAVKESNGTKVKGDWGFQVRVERAALEILYAVRKIHIADRVGSRRIFDLTEKLLPADLLRQPEPNPTLEDYHDWHVFRRIGGLGLARSGASEYWLGIQHMKAPERKISLERLLKNGKIISVQINELPGKLFYLRSDDLGDLELSAGRVEGQPEASFLPPLDNLLWDRKLISLLFGFDYTWEVYKKPQDRKYGYYTMPVLYGDRFIARMESAHDRKNHTLVIKNWWWEDDIKPGREMKSAIQACIQRFVEFLGAEKLQLPENLKF